MRSISTMEKIISTATEAWEKRKAWWYLATIKTRERYARTKLGSLWASITVLISIGILGTVYSKLLNISNIKEYIVYLGIGLITWQTISTGVNSASKTFTANALNIKNLIIHPIQYTLIEWAFQVQTFIQSFILVILTLSLVNHSLAANAIIYGIPGVINLILFLYWLPTLVSIAGAKFEDLTQLVPVCLQLTFLLSPILFERKALGSISWIAEINPIYIVISNLRDSIIFARFNLFENLAILIFNCGGIFISIIIVNSNKSRLPLIL